MFKWLKEYLEIRYQFKQQKLAMLEDSKVCKSCETLRHQLEIANFEKKQLLDSILTTKPPVEQPVYVQPESLKPKNISWAVRRQMLEAEDRKQASLFREQAKHEQELKLAAQIPRGPDGGLNVTIPDRNSIEELEKELGIGEGAS